MNAHAFWNLPPHNPTQTRLRRFVRMPSGEIPTMFSKKKADFEKTLEGGVKTGGDWMFETGEIGRTK